jgi:hypothetical protein
MPKKRKVDPTQDQSRVSPAGREAGLVLAALAEHSIKKHIGLTDKRCKTCALRAGTVPNGCYQTIADVVKCLVEKRDFNCHYDTTRQCEGFKAAMLERKNLPAGVTPWKFSDPD